VTIIFASIGLFGALQNWYVLFSLYGDLKTILLKSNTIYIARVESSIPGVIPYLQIFGHISLILSAIYSSYKGKLTPIAIITMLSVILKSLAMFERISMLIAFFEFISTYILISYYISINRSGKRQKGKLKFYITIAIISVIIVISASIVRTFRGTYENYQGAKSELNMLDGKYILTPSIYLYLCSHVGVLNRFLAEDNEKTKLGQNIFAPMYNVLSKINYSEKVLPHQKGYHIPMWSNSGTILRDLYADFGILGILCFPYLLGMLSSYSWLKYFYNGNTTFLAVLIYLFPLITLSFISSISRAMDWYAGLVLLFLTFRFIEKKYRNSNNLC